MLHDRSNRASPIFGLAIASLAASVLTTWTARSLAQAPKVQAKQAGPEAKLPPWQRVLKGDHAKKVEALEKQIAELEKKGLFAAAVVPAQEVLTIRSRMQGDDHWETVDARTREETCVRVASLTLQAQSDLATAFRQSEEGQELHRIGQSAQSEQLCRKYLEIRLRLLGENHPATAEAYLSLALTLDAQGKFGEAEPLHQTALAICHRALGDEHPHTAQCYNGLVGNFLSQYRYIEAEQFVRKALAINRGTLGENHPESATSYDCLGACLYFQGKYNESEVLAQKALAIRLGTLGEDNPSTAFSYNNLATNLDAQGKYAEAEPLYERALLINRRLLGDVSLYTVTDYNNLAANLMDQGKFAEAEPLLRKALAMSSGLLSEDHPDMARGHNSLASNLSSQGKYAEAEPLFEKAMAIYRRAVGENHRQTAHSYRTTARSLSAQGRYTEGEPLYVKTLTINRQALGEDHPDTAGSYNDLAVNLAAQGRYVEAAVLLQKAIAIRRRFLSEDHPDLALSYSTLASNLNAEGKYAEAEAMCNAAAKVYEVARLQVSSSGLDRAAFVAERSPFPRLAALQARLGRITDAWQHWEASLARGLFDDLSTRRRRPLTPVERSRQESLVGQLNRLDNQIAVLAGTKAPTEDRPKQLDELKIRRLDLQGQLAQLDVELVHKYRVAAGEVYGLDQIQAQLPANAALVGWLDLKTQPNAADPKGDHWTCVVRRTGTPMWIRIEGTGPKHTWTEADNDLPGQVRRILSESSSPDWRKSVAELANQRLEPLEAALQARSDLPPLRHLIVLPSLALAGIPVEALLEARPAGSARYLVSYAPSGTMFAWLQERRHEDRDKPAQTRRLLALGDPVPTSSERDTAPAPKPPGHGLMVRFVQPGSNAATAGIHPGDVLLSYAGTKLLTRDDLQKQVQAADPKVPGITIAVWRDGKAFDLMLKPGLLDAGLETKPAAEVILAQREGDALLRRTRGSAFTSLPGTRREVEAIAALFDQKDVYLGSDACEPLLDDLRAHDKLKQFAVIHLATHGKMDDLIPMNSRLLLSQDRLSDPTVATPLDQRFYDGTITAGEVMSTWKLNAELVTLSACQSGLGRGSGGEGFIGFGQALFLAGSRSLILSLWEVDDRATALLMTRFYQNWLGKREGLDRSMTKADALREAKEWLRGLSAAEVGSELGKIPRGDPRPKVGEPVAGERFDHPRYWTAFILMGDPT